MKKIIVEKGTDIVVFIGNQADVTSKGIDTGGAIYSQKNLQVFSTDLDTTGITVQKYCFTLADGFTPNPNYVPQTSDEVEQLKADNLILMEAIADLYEMQLGAGQA